MDGTDPMVSRSSAKLSDGAESFENSCVWSLDINVLIKFGFLNWNSILAIN